MTPSLHRPSLRPSSHSDDLALLAEVAREAGRIALSFFRRENEVWWKEGNSPVSEADYAVDAYLKAALLGARPDYGWLSEENDPRVPETEPSARATGSSEAPLRFFVVDPIDGTRAFLRGEETWCISIAVVEAGRPIAGVIEAAAMSEVFHAAAGEGASLNGAPLAVSLPSSVSRLTVTMPDPMRRRLLPGAGARLDFARNAPSLAYRLALVAAGRLDGTLIRPHAADWDIAAGDLILEEAGGSLVDLDGAARLYKIEGRRHGLLIAGARHAMPELLGLAASAAED